MNRRTTWVGILTAVATALSTFAGLPPPWSMIAQAVGVVGLALLGYYAADAKGKPRP